VYAKTGRPGEAEVVFLWEWLVRAGTVLRAETGERVRVIYPGRANDGRGGDFTDAVVAIDGRHYCGDVEVHVRSSGWQSHGHHRDAAYDRVVLHVVMWNDDGKSPVLCGGGTVPMVALADIGVSGLAPEPVGRPCRREPGGSQAGVVLDRIERCGESRFLAKAAVFTDDLARMAAGQALYRGIMGALGYSRNKAPFMELASRAPLAVLEDMARAAGRDDDSPLRLREYLLTVAGLSGNDAPGGEDGWRVSGAAEPMPTSAWQFFRVRPAGSPVHRLAAMGHLLCRYRRRGLLAGLVAVVAERTPEARCHRSLEDALIVTGGDRGMALLGRRCAAGIVVNVLLPFAVAWARSEGNTGLERAVRAAYLSYPGLPDNAVVRHMRRQLGMAGRDTASACRQQGLIHVYRTRCIQGKCPGCPMSRAFDLSRSGGDVGLCQPETGEDIDIESGDQPGIETEAAAGGDHGGIVGAEHRRGNENR